MPIAAGELDKQVTLERNTPTRNGFGEEVDAWATLATVWAGIDPKRGREFFAASQFQSEGKRIVHIRYRSGLSTKDRVRYAGRALRIEDVQDPGERHEELYLLCVEALG